MVRGVVVVFVDDEGAVALSSRGRTRYHYRDAGAVPARDLYLSTAFGMGKANHN